MASFIRAFKGVGFEQAVGGEFTKRAFLNNKIPLHEAEAVVDLIDAVDEKEVQLAGRSLFGDMSKKIVRLAENIDLLRVRVEAEIDFSDEGNDYLDNDLFHDVCLIRNKVSLFIGGCVNKKNYFQKNKVLLVGPVNSGKSSVFNRLVGFERAIVSDVPGTTRDIVSSELFYESNSFSVFDSAGLRSTSDVVEEIGIKSTLKEIKSHLLKVDGVMIGRAIYHSPYFLAEIEKEIFNNNNVPTRTEVMEKLIPYIEEETSKGTQLNHIMRHTIGLFHGQNGSKTWKQYLSKNMCIRDADLQKVNHIMDQVRKTNPVSLER